jgi:hypothetical protein
MSTDTQSIPTPAEIREKADSVAARIAKYDLQLHGTISDYPIGRRERGLCRLEVERVKGKGYRTVRTTTDKHVRWCKPKKSTFRNDCTVVATGIFDHEHTIQWLCVGDSAVYLQAANGSTTTLMKAPHYCKPNREARTVTWTTTSFSPYGGDEPVRSKSQDTIPADPPELCDAYDAWIEVVRELRKLVARVWDEQPA